MSNNKYFYASAVAFSFALAALQVLVYQWCEIGTLKRELRLTAAAKAIADDQVRELSMNLGRMCAEQDSASIKGFVQGVVDAINRPDHYRTIWHDGYDRGMQTFKYATDEEETRPR